MRLAVFFIDAGSQYGLGHLRRCLTLAEELHDLGFRCCFYSAVRVPNGDTRFEWKQLSYDMWEGAVTALEEAVDIAIVDSYCVEQPFIHTLRKRAIVLVEINDSGIPFQGPDIVVNPVTNKIRNECFDGIYLGGLSHVLLRRDFSRVADRAIRENVRTIFVTLGGSACRQKQNAVLRPLTEILHRYHPLACDLQRKVDVVVGVGPFAESPDTSRIPETRCRLIIKNQPCMFYEMLNADLAISGGGQTVFELLATGTPTIALQVAGNQASNLRLLAEEKGLVLGGILEKGGWEKVFARQLLKLVNSPDIRRQLSWRGAELVDGFGARRVASVIAQEWKKKIGEMRGTESV